MRREDLSSTRTAPKYLTNGGKPLEIVLIILAMARVRLVGEYCQLIPQMGEATFQENRHQDMEIMVSAGLPIFLIPLPDMAAG
jgi:hypothetical protein